MKQITTILVAFALGAGSLQALTTSIQWIDDSPTAMTVQIAGVGMSNDLLEGFTIFSLISPSGLWLLNASIGARVQEEEIIASMGGGVNFVPLDGLDPNHNSFFFYVFDEFVPANPTFDVGDGFEGVEEWIGFGDFTMQGSDQFFIPIDQRGWTAQYRLSGPDLTPPANVPDTGGLACLVIGLLGMCAFTRIPRTSGQ